MSFIKLLDILLNITRNNYPTTMNDNSTLNETPGSLKYSMTPYNFNSFDGTNYGSFLSKSPGSNNDKSEKINVEERSELGEANFKNVSVEDESGLLERGPEEGGVSLASNYTKGTVVLMTIPILWSTFSPVLRILQMLKPIGMPIFLFNAIYHFLGIFPIYHLGLKEFRRLGLTSIVDDIPWLEGIETTLYLFIGGVAHFLANEIRGMPVDRIEFEIQLQNLIVPLLQITPLFRNNFGSLPFHFWICAAVVTLGIVLLGSDRNGNKSSDGTASSSRASFGYGDVYSIGCALFYSFFVLRTGQIMSPSSEKRIPKMVLTVVQALVFALLSIPICIYQWSSYRPFLVEFFQGGYSFGGYCTIIVMVVFNVLVTGYTYWAFNYGQQYVPPSHAALIQASTPIWASILAYLTLGETLGLEGAIGCVLIVFGLAFILVST